MKQITILLALLILVTCTSCGIIGRFVGYNDDFKGGRYFRSTHVSRVFAAETDPFWDDMFEMSKSYRSKMGKGARRTSGVYRMLLPVPFYGALLPLNSSLDIVMSAVFDIGMLPIDLLYNIGEDLLKESPQKARKESRDKKARIRY